MSKKSEIIDQLYNIGDWVWCKDYYELGQIRKIKRFWGYETCEVWIPSKKSIEIINLLSLTKKDEYLVSKANIVFCAAVAKVVNALAQHVLLAPLETNLIPLPHQLAILSKISSSDPIRFLLADEVGLGKTIEAGLVIRELKLKGLVKRTLVIAPKGLTTQWAQEMKYHFNEYFRIVNSAEIPLMTSVFEEDNFWQHFDQVICSLDSVKPIKSRKGWSNAEVDAYNQERLELLATANWDLVIIDEAHRVAGSSPRVARYLLGKRLSEITPYLLLLSATPHQGKSDAFIRLLSLLDKQAFPSTAKLTREKIKPFVMRTEKRKAIDNKGNLLFKERRTGIVPIKWETRHRLQKQLYEEVTKYVREGYNRALEEKKNYIGFLMTLMQRLVSSSTKAISQTLRKRLEIIESGNYFFSQLDSWQEMDGQEQLENILSIQVRELQKEKQDVWNLLNLATRCEALNLDAKAEALLECIHSVQLEENDLDLKILIFTEFIPTQDMLKEFLEQRGFICVTINGSKNITERLAAQERFSADAQIMLSTDAGGEGLNMQFSHIVINYDLPWNPMKIEQRIGRVDRIGQNHPVKAFNFILEGTIEFRVQEVLQEKLAIILEDFGVDKTSDVLDATESANDFEKIYMNSILHPERIDDNIDEFVSEIKQEFQNYSSNKQYLSDIDEIDPSLADQITNHPFPYWLEIMTLNFLKMKGGKYETMLVGYNLILPDNRILEKVTFHKMEAERYNLNLFSLNSDFASQMIRHQRQWFEGQPVPQIILPKLSKELCGYFSLWKISIADKDDKAVRIFPLFTDLDGKVLRTTANYIWDALIDSKQEIRVLSNYDLDFDAEKCQFLFQLAERTGKESFIDLQKKRSELIEKEMLKAQFSFQSREESINRIGLPNVRLKRLNDLKMEKISFFKHMRKKERILPDLQPLLIVKVINSG